jgi:hypothetical protein
VLQPSFSSSLELVRSSKARTSSSQQRSGPRVGADPEEALQAIRARLQSGSSSGNPVPDFSLAPAYLKPS